MLAHILKFLPANVEFLLPVQPGPPGAFEAIWGSCVSSGSGQHGGGGTQANGWFVATGVQRPCEQTVCPLGLLCKVKSVTHPWQEHGMVRPSWKTLAVLQNAQHHVTQPSTPTHPLRIKNTCPHETKLQWPVPGDRPDPIRQGTTHKAVSIHDETRSWSHTTTWRNPGNGLRAQSQTQETMRSESRGANSGKPRAA